MNWDNVTELAVNQFLRRIRCKMDPGRLLPGFTGVDLLSATQVRIFHEQLLPIGIPFRVNVRGVAETSRVIAGSG